MDALRRWTSPERVTARECAVCDKQFKPSRSDIAYCSEDCRQAAARWRTKFDWAEPGDQRPPNYEKVRAKRVPKPTSYPRLTPEVELELIRRYHDTGDEEALERLVGAHRPMVVRMAKHMWRTGVPLKVFVEYGMLGLRIAAQPPRPSKTKKGATVGFDPSTGNRFSTYARSYAAKEMRAAIADDVYEPLVKPEFEQKATVEFEEWSTAESLKGPLPPILRHLRERRKSPPCILPLTLWHPPTWAKDQYERPVKLRAPQPPPSGPIKTPSMAFGPTRSSPLKHWPGREGLEDEDERWDIENNFMIASLLRNHAFTGKEFRLPKEVLLSRWRYGCKRLGIKDPYRFNQGLGLFDKKGHLLPDFSHLEGKVQVIRAAKPTPFLCIKPVGSIYYMRGTDTCEVISLRRYRPAWHDLNRHAMIAGN